jgi:hypothetical protein
MGWILAALFLFAAVGNLCIAIRWHVRSKSGSFIPYLGGLAGLAACFALPFRFLRNWWWVPLFADLGTAYLTVAIGLFMVRWIYRRTYRGDFE